MTLAFETFMKQYKMTGSEKADGYSEDAFIGLDDRERDSVFRLLAAELPWSVEWLFFVDPEKAMLAAKQKEEDLRGDGYAHVYRLQEYLVKYSGDLVYQKHMIDDYATYADGLKPRVIDAINRTPANDEVCNFFKEVILLKVNTVAVTRAARHLLDLMKIPRATGSQDENYKRLMVELRSDNIGTKKRIFSELERYRSSTN